MPGQFLLLRCEVLAYDNGKPAGASVVPSDAYYHVAQICMNGHVISYMIDYSPQRSEAFCSNCGEPTIRACPHCNTPIRGKYNVPGVVSFGGDYTAPSFCFNCAKPFPWTERATQAAIELFTEEIGASNTQEIDQFKDTLDNLVKETPRTPLAAGRFRKAMGKVGTMTCPPGWNQSLC
jgi:hypothetical protein